MIPRYAIDCAKLFLQITVVLMDAIPTSCRRQSNPTETDDSVIIRNVGIKMCQLKCFESGLCSSIEYSHDTLSCRLLRAEAGKTKPKEGFVSLARDHSDVPNDSCPSEMCSLTQRCLKTRSGKSVCVQDEGQGVPEKSSQYKADPRETTAASPLHDACRKGNLTRVRGILSQSLVDVNSRDGNHGKTPLMVAAQEGHCRLFEFLIRKGANRSQVDNHGKNILHWACKGGHEDMVDCVLPHYDVDINRTQMPPFLQAANKGSKDVCEFLVCMGANVSQVDHDGDSALHLACRGGHLEVLTYLLSLRSLDNIINSLGKTGATPLMEAAMAGHGDMFKILVRMGANVSQVDDVGNNVLHYSALAGNMDLVKHIVRENMVNITDRNKRGFTVAMMAEARARDQMYDFLVSRGSPKY